MAKSFFDQPILNSPYTVPEWHHALDDEGQPLNAPPCRGGGTLSSSLIDSVQVDSGRPFHNDFKAIAASEIDQFKRELVERTGDVSAGEKITEEDLLREVMNTVDKPGCLGEQIRCVVSVSMLTEGWDTNTVTHILGVRAFSTQLLCEQVVGRGLRRQSYEEQEDGLFEVEYADILGIPFDFTAKPVVAIPKPPKPTVRVQAVKERAALEITFPRVEGYRVDLPEERLNAVFTEDSRLILTPEEVGPVRVLLEGIVGEGVEIGPDVLKNQGFQFEVPYRDGGVPRKYIPDFIVRLAADGGEPLNLILETKGYRGADAQVKAETMKTPWVPGVNNLGTFGQWHFEEFTDVFEIEAGVVRLIETLTRTKVFA